MELFIHLVGFVGGWLLVAGPVFQAALELRDEELDQSEFEQSWGAVPPPAPLSHWWWLLPPVAYLKSRRRKVAYRDATFAALDLPHRQQLMGFMNKAHGWILVALGALCIALKETWELVELVHFPVWTFWVAIVVLGIAAVLSTVFQLSRSDAKLHLDEPDYAAKQREQQRLQRQAQAEARRAKKA